jgi:hypothetical protein
VIRRVPLSGVQGLSVSGSLSLPTPHSLMRARVQVTTHVVAANANTEKVATALRQGKRVVGPEWVQACLFRWQRVPEADHPAPQPKSKGSIAGGQAGTGAGEGGGGVGGAPVDELALALKAAGGGG